MKTMFRSIVGAMVLAATAAHGGGESAASQPAPPQPSMQRESLDELAATVVSVDPNTRIIQLRADGGRTGAYTAGPEVKNFVSKYREKFKATPDGLAALGYDAALVLFDAMERSPSMGALGPRRGYIRPLVWQPPWPDTNCWLLPLVQMSALSTFILRAV